MAFNVLHIAPDFNFVSGVTRYITTLMELFKNDNEFQLHLIINKGDAIDIVRDLGYSTKVITFETGYRGILNLFPIRHSVEKYCVEKHIDIIHSHHRYPELIAKYISKRYKIKTITTAHSIVKGLKILSFQSDKILAVSYYVANFLKEKYDVKEDKIVVLHNCILNELYNESIPTLVDTQKKKDQHTILLYAGRFALDKGTDILLEAFSVLKEKIQCGTLVVRYAI